MKDDDLFADDNVKEEIAVVQELRDKQQLPDAEDVSRARADASRLMVMARSIEVTDQDTYEMAVEMGKQCAKAVKSVTENSEFKEGLETAQKMHKWFTDLRASLVNPYKEARKIVDTKSSAWYRKEQARIAEERQQKQREADAAAEEARLELAEKLEKEGNFPAVERVLDEPVVAAPVKVEGAPEVDGVSHRANWKAEGVDLEATIKAVYEGRAPIELLTYDDKELTRRAKALKQAFQADGINVYDAGTVAYR